MSEKRMNKSATTNIPTINSNTTRYSELRTSGLTHKFKLLEMPKKSNKNYTIIP